jgi:ferritin-like metal-binding protein YciE
MATTPRDILLDGLRNAYGLEGQALTTMENVHGRLEHYPELKAVIGQHIEETRRQQQLIEQCLSRLGEEPSTLKEAVMKLMGNVQAMVHGMAGDEVLKNLFSLYAFEHFEIASYKSLIAIAEDCGEVEVARVCGQILQQEETAGRKLGQLIESVTQSYLQRETADATASR